MTPATLPPEAAALMAEYLAASDACSIAEAKRQLPRLRLLQLLGKASEGVLPDGKRVVRRRATWTLELDWLEYADAPRYPAASEP